VRYGQVIPEPNNGRGLLPPDSDANIFDGSKPDQKPTGSGKASRGNRFMEMQFYGARLGALAAGDSCDSTQLCAAAEHRQGLSEDPERRTVLNNGLPAVVGRRIQSTSGGGRFINITASPIPGGPPNPSKSN